ncbi:hypothetical protein ACPCAC_12610 [Streptomyces lavendulocolor]|uniref:hypothetical protein n=1 Tax=Streptomyces lavendulocolor TaxID=67316 RepID=UPI003C2D11DA
MIAKRMVEFSFSVPADCKASVSLNHTKGGTTGRIETENGCYDIAVRHYDINEEDNSLH